MAYYELVKSVAAVIVDVTDYDSGEGSELAVGSRIGKDWQVVEIGPSEHPGRQRAVVEPID